MAYRTDSCSITKEVEVEIDVNVSVECECGETLDCNVEADGDDISVTAEPHFCKECDAADVVSDDVARLFNMLDDLGKKAVLVNADVPTELQEEMVELWQPKRQMIMQTALAEIMTAAQSALVAIGQAPNSAGQSDKDIEHDNPQPQNPQTETVWERSERHLLALAKEQLIRNLAFHRQELPVGNCPGTGQDDHQDCPACETVRLIARIA